MEMHLERLVPELVLTGIVLVMLVADFVMKGRSRTSFAMVGIVATLALSIGFLCNSNPGTALAGLFIQDGVSVFFKFVFLITTAIVLYTAKLYDDHIKQWRGEFYCLILFAAIAMMFLASSADFISFYVSLEFMAITLYILAAYSTEDRGSVEAGLKYLITGALASGFLLYGVSFIYGAAGTTNFVEVAEALSGREVDSYLFIGFTLVIIGLTFKISALPFHIWAPDVYEGSPTPVTALLASGSKAAGFVVMMRILFTALGPVYDDWVGLVIILAILTLLFGNLAAMPQKNIKRLIAYAGIGSAGYLLMGIAAATPLGAGAIMFYMLTYILAIGGSFIAIVAFYNAEGSNVIESYSGLSKRAPVLAASIFIGFLSLAGVPPLGGFVAKLYLFMSVVERGYYLLAIVGLVMAIVAMYYFLLVVRAMYLREPVDDTPIEVATGTRLILYVISGATVFLGLFFGPATDWAMVLAKSIF